MQKRSIERFERILDSCARLLDEVGFDDLTVHAVAARSGVPIGTLYQFFDGKTGMLTELGLRNLDRLLERVRARAAIEPIASWPRAAEIVLEEDVEMMRTTPGFAVMDFGDSRGLVSPETVAERLYAFATEEIGLPPLPDWLRVIVLVSAAGGAAVRLAFQSSRDGDPEMIEQGSRLVRAYLADAARSG